MDLAPRASFGSMPWNPEAVKGCGRFSFLFEAGGVEKN